MTLYILVMCAHKANNGEYDLLAKTIKHTWGKQNNPNIKVFYLWCNNYKQPDEYNYVLNKEEGYGQLLWKTLGFLFKHRHDDFDYIFRVNVGCYVHTERLYNHLLTCPRTNFYSGPIDRFEDIYFISGTGFILSKDLVLLSLCSIKSFGKDHIDDVSFGRFMMRKGVEFTPDYSRVIYGNPPCEKTYHWKLRSADGNRKQDAENMIALHKQFHP